MLFRSGQQRQHQYNSNSQQSQHTQAKGEDNKKHGKVFTEDEGEYVDFEEIKD